jgi:hypothetical protein
MNKVGMVTVLLILITVSTLALHLSTTDIEFSRFNREWTGTSEFFIELEAANGAEDIVPPADLPVRNNTLLLIIAPNTSFSSEEISSLKEFLSNGNTIFIADETGSVNGLLEGLGSTIRINTGDISSIDMELYDYWTVIGYPREDDPLITNVSALTLNGPSALSGGNILVATTLISWDDKNANYHLDPDEPLSSFGILSRDSVGNGTLYVLSDPSIFINGMKDISMESDNDVFFGNLLSLHPAILVEQSHSLTASTDSVLAAGTWIKTTMIIKISLLILCILLVGVTFHRRWI